LDHSAVVCALAAQRPLWPPGSAHGYHVRTYGYISDEIVRRLAGISISEYWRREFGDPMGLDFWLGVPKERLEDISPVFPAKNAPPKGDPFYVAFSTPDSPTVRAFGSPSGFSSVAAMNTPEARQISLPASGGIGTAHALGKFYAMLACGGELDGRSYFRPETLEWMVKPQVQGEDLILKSTTSFAFGFMKDPLDANGAKLRSIFGPGIQTFGHPGAGGSLGFADPVRGLAFGYVMNQMEPGVFPNSKALALVEALYGEVETL
jgi:CubicO group peptidase (beta-lactamase class C family)